jgi:hypothetical protein
VAAAGTACSFSARQFPDRLAAFPLTGSSASTSALVPADHVSGRDHRYPVRTAHLHSGNSGNHGGLTTRACERQQKEDLGASAPNTVLGFAVLVGLGVAVSGWALLRRRP